MWCPVIHVLILWTVFSDIINGRSIGLNVTYTTESAYTSRKFSTEEFITNTETNTYSKFSTDTELYTKTEVNRNTVFNTNAELNTNTESDTNAKSTTVTELNTSTVFNTNTELNTNTESDTNAKSTTVIELNTSTAFNTNTELNTNTESDTNAKPTTFTELNTSTVFNTNTELNTNTESDTNAKSTTVTELNTSAKLNTNTESGTNAKSTTITELNTNTESNTNKNSTTVSELNNSLRTSFVNSKTNAFYGITSTSIKASQSEIISFDNNNENDNIDRTNEIYALFWSNADEYTGDATLPSSEPTVTESSSTDSETMSSESDSTVSDYTTEFTSSEDATSDNETFVSDSSISDGTTYTTSETESSSSETVSTSESTYFNDTTENSTSEITGETTTLNDTSEVTTESETTSLNNTTEYTYKTTSSVSESTTFTTNNTTITNRPSTTTVPDSTFSDSVSTTPVSANDDGPPIAAVVGAIIGVLVVGIGAFVVYMSYIGKLNCRSVHKIFGQPRLSVRPDPIPLKRYVTHCEQLLSNPSRIDSEFHLLATLSSDLVSTYPQTAGQLPDNRKKNRYVNIIPYDATRVKLDPIEGDSSTDYINASYIKGYSGNVEYIACQGPKEETCSDFWRMVLQCNVQLIIMVTQFEEQNKAKCDYYFPTTLRENMTIGDFIIRCATELSFPDYTERSLVIHKDGRKKTVKHLHFQSWPDFGCPKDPEIMLQFCKTVREHINEFETGLTVIHCSAGVGRTGTLIALDILLQHIKYNKKIDIFGTVYDLRHQRVNMVQSEAQYKYIYECMLKAIQDPNFFKSDKQPQSGLEPIYENVMVHLRGQSYDKLKGSSTGKYNIQKISIPELPEAEQ